MKNLQFVSLDIEELRSSIAQSVSETLDTKLQLDKAEDDLLSCEEVESFLKISPPTRIEWTKKGILKSYSISRRVYYKKSEVLQALIPLK